MQGHGADRAFREFVGDNILAIDLTPMPGIDDLLQPTESIKEAQELAAEAYGADHTFFLDQRFDQRQSMHDDDRGQSRRKDRRAA